MATNDPVSDEPESHKDDPEWIAWLSYLRRQRSKNHRFALRNSLLIGEDALDEISESIPETDSKPPSPTKKPTKRKGWRKILLSKERSRGVVDGSSNIRIVFIPPDKPPIPNDPDDSKG